MKLKILLVFFLTHFYLNGSAQNLGLMDEKFDKVRAENKIKKIQRFVSTGVKKGKLTFKLENESIYNRQGKIEKSIRYIGSNTDSSTDKVTRHIQSISYDNQGRIISFIDKVDFYNEYSHDIIIHKTFIYDQPESDLIASVYYLRPDSSLIKSGLHNFRSTPSSEPVLKYDSLSNQYTHRKFKRNQKLAYEKTMQLNNQKQIIRVSELNFVQRKFTFTNYTYDQQGNELEVKQTTKSGKVLNRYFNTFNANGLLAQTTWTKE